MDDELKNVIEIQLLLSGGGGISAQHDDIRIWGMWCIILSALHLGRRLCSGTITLTTLPLKIEPVLIYHSRYLGTYKTFFFTFYLV